MHVVVRVVTPSGTCNMTRWLGGGPSNKSAFVSMGRKMSLIYALDILMKSCRF